MMDKIIMKDMVFYGYHGVLKEEKTLGQKFHVDAEIHLDLKKAGKTDDLDETVSYAMIYETIKNVMVKENFDLLEALSHKICGEILLSFEKMESLLLKIRKPGAPVAGNFDYFAIEIKRSREDYEWSISWLR